jgi:ABC-type sulfate transport system substrate-binding protein
MIFYAPVWKILASNPESEDGRWSYLAAWGYALKQSDGDEAVAREFVKNLFAMSNCRILSPEREMQ